MLVGDIVWSPFPFTNMTETKIRPVLVVADVRGVGESDWLVCQITSSPRSHAREIAIGAHDMQSGQLRPRSRVRPDRLSTLEESVFQEYVGRLTDAKISEILAAARALFQPSRTP